jgi:hypothetical protein
MKADVNSEQFFPRGSRKRVAGADPPIFLRAIASRPFGVVNAPYCAAESAAPHGFLGSLSPGSTGSQALKLIAALARFANLLSACGLETLLARE